MLRNRLLISSILSLALAGTLVAVSPARSADFEYEPTMEEAVTQVEYGTGWYLRGNISAGFSQFRSDSGADAFDDDFHANAPYSFSIGVGTKVGSNMRAEVLYEHFGELENIGSHSFDCAGVLEPNNCFYASHILASAQGLSANGYIDLGNWQRFKPYIGAGVGVMSVSYDQFTVLGLCEGTVDTSCNGNGVGQSVVSTPQFDTQQSSIQVMGNLQVGAGFKLTDNLTLDAGYRLTAIHGDTLRDTTAAANARASFDTGTFVAHELRVGLRYEIW